LVAIEWGVCKLKNEIIIIILFYGINNESIQGISSRELSNKSVVR